MRLFSRIFLVILLCAVGQTVYADLSPAQVDAVVGWTRELEDLRAKKEDVATAARMAELDKRINLVLADQGHQYVRERKKEVKSAQRNAAVPLQRLFREKRKKRIDAAVAAGELRRDPLTLLVQANVDNEQWELAGVDEGFVEGMVVQIKGIKPAYEKFFWDIIGNPLVGERHQEPVHGFGEQRFSDAQCRDEIVRAWCVTYRRKYEQQLDKAVAQGMRGVVAEHSAISEWAGLYEAWKKGERTDHPSYGYFQSHHARWKDEAHGMARDYLSGRLESLWLTYLVACASIEWLRISDDDIGFPQGPYSDDALTEDEMVSVRLGILVRLARLMFNDGLALGGIFGDERSALETSPQMSVIFPMTNETLAQLQAAKHINQHIPTGGDASYTRRTKRTLGLRSTATDDDEQDLRRSFEARHLMTSFDCYRLLRLPGMAPAVFKAGIIPGFSRDKAGELYEAVVLLRGVQNKAQWRGASLKPLVHLWQVRQTDLSRKLQSNTHITKLLETKSLNMAEKKERSSLYRKLLRQLLPWKQKTEISFAIPQSYGELVRSMYSRELRKQAEREVAKGSVAKEQLDISRDQRFEVLLNEKVAKHYRDGYVLFLFFLWHAVTKQLAHLYSDIGREATGVDKAVPAAAAAGSGTMAGGVRIAPLVPDATRTPPSRFDEAEGKLGEVVQSLRDGSEQVYDRVRRTMKEFSDSFTRTNRIMTDLKEGKTGSAVDGLLSIVELAQTEVGRLNTLIDETGGMVERSHRQLIDLLEDRYVQGSLLRKKMSDLLHIKQQQINDTLDLAKGALQSFGRRLDNSALLRKVSGWGTRWLLKDSGQQSEEERRKHKQREADTAQLMADISRIGQNRIRPDEREEILAQRSTKVAE
ncbi:MAG: hypothetical protein PVJ92_00860 [Candidatus Dependentiae bacterium]|jgi:hypothetical protein